MANLINVTPLDFNEIKDNIISYFQNVKDSEGNFVYADWDFSGSTINTLIDVLAYNTHYNAMLAHTAVNESFIDSAQLRSSVVSAAKLLGYVPKSATAAGANIKLTFNGVNGSFYIDRNSIFKATSQTNTFYYVLEDGVTITADKNIASVNLIEGRRVTKRYTVNGANTEEKYIIDDENIDMSTLIVRVMQNVNTPNQADVYTRYTDITTLSPSSKVYYVSENSLGKYEITFGDGVLSAALNPLNIIELEYVTTHGADANGVRGPFLISSLNKSGDGKYDSVEIEVSSISSGGAARESVSRIRDNSTKGFVSQNRAVTADDYKNIILTQFQNADSVSIWGGEDNDPPQYGKVFVSIKKKGTLEQLTLQEKTKISQILAGKKVLSIIPEVIDREDINLVLDVLFKYNPNLVTGSQSNLENAIREDVISAYNTSQLNSFEKIFRYSQFTKAIDNYSTAVLNNHVRVFVSRNFSVDPTVNTDIIAKYGTKLTVDDDRAVAGISILSGSFTHDGQRLYIGDFVDSNNSDIRTLYTYTFDNNVKRVISENIGNIVLSSGIITISQLGLCDGASTIALDLIPISNDIVPKRNQIISIDVPRCNVNAYVDEIAVGGSSRAISYQTFTRDR